MSLNTEVRLLTSIQPLDPITNEITNIQVGTTGTYSEITPIEIGTYPTVEVKSNDWGTKKAVYVDWYTGATLNQREAFNLIGPTGSDGISIVTSPNYSAISGPTGSLSDLKTVISYGATAEDTVISIKVTNPSPMYGEIPHLNLWSSENPSGPYDLQYSADYPTPGDATDLVNFPSTHYLRIDFYYPNIPEVVNQTSFSIYSDLYYIENHIFTPNLQSATGQVYQDSIYEQIPIKSGTFSSTSLINPESAIYYYDVVFNSQFPTDSYSLNVIGLGPDGKIYAGEDKHSDDYEPFIFNKGTTGFRYQIYDGTHGITGYNFMWTAIYEGENSTITDSDVLTDGTKTLVLGEPIRSLEVDGSKNVYYIDINTETI